MALAYDQQTVVANSGGVDSLTMAAGQAVDSGDLLVICVATFFTNGTGGTWVVSDDINGTWTEAIDVSGPATSWVGVFFFQNSASGTVTATVNPNGTSADMAFTFSEVSGAATTGALDVTATNTGTSTTPSVATGVLNQANEIIFAVVGHSTGIDTAITPDATYTQIGEHEGQTNAQAYNSQQKIVATTASDQADWTTADSVAWFACLATFKESGQNKMRWPIGMGIGGGSGTNQRPGIIG